MRIAASHFASHNRPSHSIAPKGDCRCATTILAIRTLATATTGFEIGKRTGSQRDIVSVRQHLTTKESVGMLAIATEPGATAGTNAAPSIRARSSHVTLNSRADLSASWFAIAFTTVA